MKRKIWSKRIISAVTAALMIFAIGCSNKTIDTSDYPVPVVEGNEEVQNQTNEETEEKHAGYLSDVSDEDVLKPEKNSLKEDGKYTYNPAIIPKWIVEKYKDNPKIIRVSKEILIAINNCDTEYVLDENLKMTDEEINLVSNIVYVSNPIASIVYWEPTETKNVFKLLYFPYYGISEAEAENGTAEPVSVDMDEVKNTVDDFKNYVSDTINNNITADMNEKEMAAAVYRHIIKDYEFAPKDTDDYLSLNFDTISEGEMVKGAIENKYTSGIELERIFSFFMCQLQIEMQDITGGGGYFDKKIQETLGDKRPLGYGWLWQIVYLDGEPYHADIILEKLIYDEKNQDNEDAEPELLFFGMSDETRMETYKFSSTNTVIIDLLTGEDIGDIPKCTNDYSATKGY